MFARQGLLLELARYANSNEKPLTETAYADD